ncbi:MAG: Tol-Pal system beta propeller repeat protein TolB [Desulfobulbaceae bacterium]|uniref:Tol-Pal system beta propeller repeat protein TolB n=1 Tax=Candidatus Desulfatifera sulfidica TaxID=2841691 RepID=A0A8J6N971_9BACT|nr:Tol-Pal system beta propeller repeat protein TolB [Candidatus Desulfatifera sulfidica]
MKQFSIFTLFILFFWINVPALQAQDRVYLDITSPGSRKINVAVPQFTNQAFPQLADRKGQDFARLLERSLDIQGIFSIITDKKHLHNQKANWNQLGADYVILGNYSSLQKAIQLELRLLDVSADRVITGKRYNGTSGQEDEILYRFTDHVVLELTGQPGIASTTLAFISDASGKKELYTSDPLGRKIRQITRHKSLVISPRFTPDGQSLSYTSFHSGNSNLYITDLHKKSRGNRVLSRQPGMNLAPAWNPDGRSMILTLSKNGSPDLYHVDRNGRILKQLTKRAGINVSPAMSPDGKRIAFVSDRSGTPQLYIMELTNGNVQRITFVGNENTEPVWSPKGDMIAYTGRINGSYQIFTIQPGPRNKPFQVTKGLGQNEQPCWAPDGNQLLFVNKNGDKSHLYLIHKNGSNKRQFFSFQGNVSAPRWTR